MINIYDIVLTSLFTVLGGIAIFIAGQLAIKFFIDPIHAYKILIGEISYSLIYFSNVGPGLIETYFQQLENASKLDEPRKQIAEERIKGLILDDWKDIKDAKISLRKQASELMSTTNAIPFYRFWAFFRLLPKLDDINKASANLIGLSNSVGSNAGVSSPDRRKGIIKLLRIKTLSKRFGK